MKKKIHLLVITLIVALTSATAQSAATTWPEMKNFHHFISTSFHPSEEGNLLPLRQKADSMYTAAKQWHASAIPAGYKTEETKKALHKLLAKCMEIKNNVTKNAGDEILKKQIGECHDIFHSIVKECRKED